MGFGSSSSSTKIERYVGIPVQTSIKGISITRGWGTFKCACNLVDYLDFKSKGKKQGGKGGGGVTSYDYWATVLMGVCIGPIDGIRKLWRDSETFDALTDAESPGPDGLIALKDKVHLSLMKGELGQAPWSYLTSSHSDHALGYSRLAYVYAKDYALNSSATLANHNFEVQSLNRAVIDGETQDDAWPHEIATNLLTSIPQWTSGMLSVTDWGNYCIANGFMLSPSCDAQKSAAAILQEILDASNSSCVFSDGTLKMVPFGDTAVTGNGVTWTPNLTPVYDFELADILSEPGDDPIKWSLVKPADRFNIASVEYQNRSSDYSTDVVTADDFANIQVYGKRKKDQASLHCIKQQAIASHVAQLMVQRSANLCRACTFDVSEKFGLLEPQVDLVTVPLRDGGRRMVRIIEINENPDDGALTITAEEMLVGAAHAATYTRQTSQGVAVNYSVLPGDTAVPAIFDVPVQLAQVMGLETWLAVCSADANPNWGGCQVWVSTDGVTYGYNQTISGASRMGTLTATFAAGSDPDTTHTLAIDLTNSAGLLDSGTASDADTGTTLCFVDGEYVAYRDATLTSAYHYNLGGYLRRGMWGSQNASHASGSSFVRLDDAVAKIPYTAADVGRTIHIKLLSFNVYGHAVQQLADVTAHTHVVGGPPTIYAASSVSAVADIKGVLVKWVNALNVGIQAVEIWRSATSSFSGASKIADAPAYATSYVDKDGTVSGTQYWYWVRYRDIAGNNSQYAPSTSGAGATITSGMVQTTDVTSYAISKQDGYKVTGFDPEDGGSWSEPDATEVTVTTGGRRLWPASTGLGTPQSLEVSFNGSYRPTTSDNRSVYFGVLYLDTASEWKQIPGALVAVSTQSILARQCFALKLAFSPSSLTDWNSSGAVRPFAVALGSNAVVTQGFFNAQVLKR